MTDAESVSNNRKSAFHRPCTECGNPVHSRSAVCNVCGAESPWPKPIKASQSIEAPESPAVRSQPKSGGTVTVACKIPGGLDLQLCKKVTYMLDTPTGAVPRDRWDRYGRIYTLRGPNYPVGMVPKGFPAPPQVEGGYALTHNIPADFWEQWFAQNLRSSYIEAGMIFAHSSRTDFAVGQARDQAELKSGLEPLNPDGDPRAPRPLNKDVSALKTAEV
jgi:hypothetical protein